MANVPPQGGRKHPQQEFIQVDTSNILFICGGAFDGLEKIVQNRMGKQSMGFGGEVRSKKEMSLTECLKSVEHHDIVKFGLIPELVGRLPMLVTLEALDEAALLNVLTQPKNAITKQYAKLFEFDGVELEFEEEALRAVARKTIDRGTGARGLRSVIENIMTGIMFDVPSDLHISKVIITEDCVTSGAEPKVIRTNDARKPIMEQLVLPVSEN